ncbi:hypothetical protein [Nocardia concava]|uniref:hypothetical protein n=1 Tax=Nocardia concava TaxID=257281 RepID=UPI0003055A0C|nr:hypothetical protein [Nocardia concava]
MQKYRAAAAVATVMTAGAVAGAGAAHAGGNIPDPYAGMNRVLVSEAFTDDISWCSAEHERLVGVVKDAGGIDCTYGPAGQQQLWAYYTPDARPISGMQGGQPGGGMGGGQPGGNPSVEIPGTGSGSASNLIAMIMRLLGIAR